MKTEPVEIDQTGAGCGNGARRGHGRRPPARPGRGRATARAGRFRPRSGSGRHSAQEDAADFADGDAPELLAAELPDEELPDEELEELPDEELEEELDELDDEVAGSTLLEAARESVR
jgi:hypothetical protein